MIMKHLNEYFKHLVCFFVQMVRFRPIVRSCLTSEVKKLVCLRGLGMKEGICSPFVMAGDIHLSVTISH